jgi:N-acetyl-anhydromuramyl-L-alanine amidase AmpD
MNRLRLSPNYSPGWKRDPLGIIIHWTGGKYAGSVEWLCSEQSQASAHWVVNFDGSRTQLVSTLNRAWHAGKSETKHGKNCNDYTFGIELVGPPSLVGLPGWDWRQLNEAVKLCQFLKQKYPTIEFITDHSTISPGRKNDVKKGTGIDLFPWDEFVQKTGLNDLI